MLKEPKGNAPKDPIYKEGISAERSIQALPILVSVAQWRPAAVFGAECPPLGPQGQGMGFDREYRRHDRNIWRLLVDTAGDEMG